MQCYAVLASWNSLSQYVQYNLLIFSYTLVDQHLRQNVPHSDLNIFFRLEVEITSTIQTLVSWQIEVYVLWPINCQEKK